MRVQKYNLTGKVPADLVYQIRAIITALESWDVQPVVLNPKSGFTPQQEQFITGLLGAYAQSPIGINVPDPLLQGVPTQGTTVTSVNSTSTTSGLSLITSGTTTPLITLSGTPNIGGSNVTSGTINNARLPAAISVTTVVGSTSVTGGFIVSGTAKWSAGNGDPNGAVIGSVGDIFSRQDGGALTSIYIKESGTATNTGWVAK